jgi:hypothetical protein
MRATFADTVAYILALGFVPVTESCFASPGEDAVGGFDVGVYLCGAGYYCVTVDGGYGAPIVWNGERLPMFVAWLNEYHAGWDVSTDLWSNDIPPSYTCLSDITGPI